MTQEQWDFKREHDRFIFLRGQTIWNGEQIREHFTKEQLILHVMLAEELFYYWDKTGVETSLMYIRDAYPDTTEEDLRRVYDENKDVVFDIYG